MQINHPSENIYYSLLFSIISTNRAAARVSGTLFNEQAPMLLFGMDSTVRLHLINRSLSIPGRILSSHTLFPSLFLQTPIINHVNLTQIPAIFAHL